MKTSTTTPETDAGGEPAKGNGASSSHILRQPPDFEALFPIRRVLADDGTAPHDPSLDPALMRNMMRMMIWNRELDERLTKLQRQGRIGFHIGSVGEEALM